MMQTPPTIIMTLRDDQGTVEMYEAKTRVEAIARHVLKRAAADPEFARNPWRVIYWSVSRRPMTDGEMEAAK